MPSPSHYTTPPDPAADRVIASHMERICQALLGCCEGRLQTIALTGGFGRGEGGVRREGRGTPAPVNDYDVLTVTRGDDLLAFVRTRRLVKAREPALSHACSIRVDIACKTPAMLRGAGPTVDAYETASGYRLLWGSDAPLRAIPWRSAESLPPAEATRYLFNRGAGLLWAKRMLEQKPQLPDEVWQFVLVAIQKAWLAWGDASLLLSGQYTASYAERQRRLQAGDLPGELAFVPAAYAEALHFKLQPDFRPYREVALPVALAETISRHERVWQWVETRRGLTPAASVDYWQAYLKATGPALRLVDHPRGWGRRLYCIALNLRLLGGRTGTPLLRRSLPALRWLSEHPEERLARVLPLLLFRDADPGLPYKQMSAYLGVARSAAGVDSHPILADRLLALWHPGQPFHG